jgi:hypothetical protein
MTPGLNNYNHYNGHKMETEQLTTMRVTKDAQRKIKVYKAKNDLRGQAEALDEILEKTEV